MAAKCVVETVAQCYLHALPGALVVAERSLQPLPIARAALAPRSPWQPPRQHTVRRRPAAVPSHSGEAGIDTALDIHSGDDSAVSVTAADMYCMAEMVLDVVAAAVVARTVQEVKPAYTDFAAVALNIVAQARLSAAHHNTGDNAVAEACSLS